MAHNDEKVKDTAPVTSAESSQGKYVVLASFTDAEDKGAPAGANIYWVGGAYPRDGYLSTKERIAYLMGKENKLGRPVIAGAVTVK